jgi:tRNA A-37 threonylcarbamoyl transferase component Bud32
LLQTGTIVAGYSIDGLLGQGGMATVYSATQLSLNRVVALKLMAPELGDDASFRARFKREGQLQAALDHQHIVPVYEAGEAEQGLFLAMRLIAGPTLKELILARQLDARRSVRLLTQAAQALDAAHRAGLIHRDVKPQNILVDRDEHVYLADFGLTKPLDDTARLTGTGQFLGTIDYIAPEQIQSEAATAASDCYSLTAVLYECLVGQVPFPESNEAAVLHAHVVRPPPRPSEVRPELPGALDDVIARGMAKDPAARPTSATELLRLATSAIAGSPPVAQPTALSRSPGEHERGQTTRGPATAAAGAIPSAGAAVTELRHDAERPAFTSAAAESAPPALPLQGRPAGAPVLSVIGVVLAAVLAAGGFLLGDSGTSGSGLANTAVAGHLQLGYPSSWRSTSALAPIAGITFSEPVRLAAAQPGAGVTAGEVPSAAGPTLLPAPLRARLEGGLAPGEPVRLGALQALRFNALHQRGASVALTIYAVPSSAGVATVACSYPSSAAGSFTAECARVAATLRLSGARAYPLGPSDEYARAVSGALARLSSAAARPAAQLRAAGGATAQATAAARLSAAYARAERELVALEVSPLVREAHHAIVSGLAALARGYADASAAARRGDTSSYGRARSALAGAARPLEDGLRSLGTLGYTFAR